MAHNREILADNRFLENYRQFACLADIAAYLADTILYDGA